jgi:hypothetical protein
MNTTNHRKSLDQKLRSLRVGRMVTLSVVWRTGALNHTRCVMGASKQ